MGSANMNCPSFRLTSGCQVLERNVVLAWDLFFVSFRSIEKLRNRKGRGCIRDHGFPVGKPWRIGPGSIVRMPQCENSGTAPFPAMSDEIFHAAVVPRLAMARLLITLECQGRGELPQFLGSTLRGVFGHALKRTACSLPRKCRQECLKPGECVYSYFFETPIPPELGGRLGGQHAPHPFVICSLDDGGLQCRPGEPVSLTMTLFGRGIRYFDRLLDALAIVGELGLGADRIRYRLRSVTDSFSEHWQELYDPRSRIHTATPRILDLRDQSALPPEAESQSHRVVLRFQTPTHVVRDGMPVETADIGALLARLHQRLEALTLLHGDGRVAWDEATPPAPERLDFDSEPPLPGAWAGFGGLGDVRIGNSSRLIELAERARVVDGDLYWVGWKRRSNRQRKQIPLSGLLGEALVVDVPGPCLNWLRAGQWVHVGKSTAFGMGLYSVEVLER